MTASDKYGRACVTVVQATPYRRPAPPAPVAPVALVAPASPADRPARKARKTGKHAQTIEAVKAIIAYVDEGHEVADTARTLLERFPHYKSWQAFERAYYRHQARLRRDMAAAQRMTADRAPKTSVNIQPASKVSAQAPKVSANIRPTALKCQSREKI
jgi:hypothetical protein